MAIYHLAAKPVQRSGGKSAVAAAAYRSRSTLHDLRQGMTFSYTAATDLVHAEIVGFAGDRGTLWNMAESMERRKDATVAREYEVALPRELDTPGQIELLREFAAWLNEEYGCVVDFAFHDGDGVNPHGHVLTTTRSVDADGTMSDIKISREWSDKKRKEHGLPGRKFELEKAREIWAKMANAALECSGFEERIDHRSYEDQGIDRLPTSHIGPSATAMERSGLQTRVGDHNRMIGEINLARQFELDDLRKHQAEAKSLADELANIDAEIEAIRNEPAPAPTPTTVGTIVQSNHSTSIAAVAERESSRFSIGMAKTFGEQYKSKLFRDTWNIDIDPALLKSLKWVDADARALTLKTGEQVVDKGDSVSLSKGSDDAIAAATAMAKSKGWTSVRTSGSDDFQVKSALALKDAGIKPSFRSEIAKERFRDKLREQAKLAVQKPVPAPDPKLEPKPEPAPAPDFEKLKEKVRRCAEATPPPSTNAYRDDTRKLRAWAHARWSELTAQGEPEGLAETFTTVLEEQALMAGYAPYEIKDVGLDSDWSQTMSDQKQNPTPPPRPSATTRRTWYPGTGEKPPGT